jgi:hypothetical protein
MKRCLLRSPGVTGPDIAFNRQCLSRQCYGGAGQAARRVSSAGHRHRWCALRCIGCRRGARAAHPQGSPVAAAPSARARSAVEGRVPAQQRLGRRGRRSARQCFSAPDAHGWRQVLLHGPVGGAGGVQPTRPALANRRPLLATLQTYSGSASTVSPPHKGWQPASCLHAASAARGSDTSHGTVSSDRRCLLLAPAHSVPLMDGHGGASGSLPRAIGFVPTAAHRPRMVPRRARLLLCLMCPQLCLARL